MNRRLAAATFGWGRRRRPNTADETSSARSGGSDYQSTTDSDSLLSRQENEFPVDDRRVPLVVVTGCDTGLGYSLVVRYYCGGTTAGSDAVPGKIAVVALCLEGAERLVDRLHRLTEGSSGGCSDSGDGSYSSNSKCNLYAWPMDLRDPQSVRETASRILELVESQNYKLHAVVNNAARMLMAEYEWQTTRLVTEQFRVNVLGPMELTSSLLPRVRSDRGRIINVLSHCAMVPLPGIAVYGATKAAVRAWTCGCRAENGGVWWISFYPGSFFSYSSIMGGGGRRDGYYDEMSGAFTDEQREHYGQYMRAYKEYLNMVDVAGANQDEPVPNSDLYRLMDQALWSVRPRSEYRVPEPWRYLLYSTLAHVCTAFGLHGWRDQLIRQFVSTPKFVSNRSKSA